MATNITSAAKPAYRADVGKLLRIPEHIQSHPYFCLWKWEWDAKREAWTKVPYSPKSGRAKSSHKDTFASVDISLAKYGDDYDGLGVGLFDGLSGIDIDHHVVDGVPDEFAREIIDALDSYTEVSPSGDGVHIYFNAQEFCSEFDREGYKARWMYNKRKLGLEVYVCGLTSKYLTITGDVIHEGSEGDKSKPLRKVLDKYMQRESKTIGGKDEQVLDLSDAQLIERIRASKQGDKFSRLWNGDTGDYPSESEADQALCNMLMWWCNHDVSRVDSLFRQSGLMRDKWDRDDYRKSTLEKAEEVEGGYDPNNGSDLGRALDWGDEDVIDAEATVISPPASGDGLFVLTNKEGRKLTAPVYHVVRSIQGHPRLANIGYDEFYRSIWICGPLPWDRNAKDRAWTPIDDKRLYSLLEGRINAKSRDNVRDGLAIAADDNKFDSLRDMMLRCLPQWDGELRVETMLQQLLGVDDSDYVRKTWPVFMCGAFLRAVKPGCKFELMPILSGAQGGVKTQFCTILNPKTEWYLDGPKKLHDIADSARTMYGKFVCEHGELESFKTRDWETIKAFLSRTHDKFTDKWEKIPTSIPRRTVHIGTTNRKDYLSDCTGARRFLPYEVGITRPELDLYSDEAGQYVLQAWAEVAEIYRSGKGFVTYLSPELERLAEPYREHYTAVDDTSETIIGWLQVHKEVTRVCGIMVAELALGVKRDDYHKNANLKSKVAETLDHRCVGWVRNPRRQRCSYEVGASLNEYGVQVCWERIA